jgi:DNA-directed RNA polymerase specialized sigma24 family protein
MVTSDVLESLQPSLLARARELAPDAGEDLLQEAYLRYLAHPPRATTPGQLKHWFRTTLRNLRMDSFSGRLINWR